MELIQTDLGFEKELEKIEDSFEWDEVVDTENSEGNLRIISWCNFFYF